MPSVQLAIEAVIVTVKVVKPIPVTWQSTRAHKIRVVLSTDRKAKEQALVRGHLML